MHTVPHEDPSVGMGAMDLVIEVLGIGPVADSDRKESLVGRSGQGAEDQLAQQFAVEIV